MSDTTLIPPASEREREAFEDAYQADSRDPSMAEDLRHFLTGYRAALSNPSTLQGWKLVPVEPTNEMVFDGAQLDGVLSYDLALDVYRAMLNASPPPPEQGGKG